MDHGIPDTVMNAIRSAAKSEWPDDPEMQEWMIGNEVGSYGSIAELDWGAAVAVKDEIIRTADEFSETWEDRATAVLGEVEAYNALHGLVADDVAEEVVADLKRKAAAAEDTYEMQLHEVTSGIEYLRYVRRTREAVGPRRDLLVRMEQILGAECYNDNIQNYGSWGVWEGEGRSFRYPVTFIRNGKAEKRKQRTEDLQAEELITGHYKFGANELSVFRGLMKIIDMLEAEYDLVPRRSTDV